MGARALNKEDPALCSRRYCARYNKGKLPPADWDPSVAFPPTHEQSRHGAWGACCCTYRSLSVMEM